MKKIAVMGLALMVALLLSFSAQAKPAVNPAVNEGVSCTDGVEASDGYFTTKFWKERFFFSGVNT